MVLRQVSVAFEANHVADVYALYGDGENHLIIPPAFQVPTPFGTSVGPQNPAFFAVQPDCEFDSFLTIVRPTQQLSVTTFVV